MLSAIITPVYATLENERLGLLDKTVRSVQRQDSPYVHLIVDDGSTANVREAVARYQDPRLRYIRREKAAGELKTASNAINAGIDILLDTPKEVVSRKELELFSRVTYLHSDDLIVKGGLQSRLAAADQGAVFTDMAVFNDNGDIVNILSIARTRNYAEWIGHIRAYSSFPNHTAMWSVDFLKHLREFCQERYGQKSIFDPRLFSSEDVDVSLSTLEAAIARKSEVRYLPSVSILYRAHSGDSVTNSRSASEAMEQRKKMLSKHFSTYDWKDVMGRMVSDMPWSLGAYLPEGIKRKVRPIRSFLKRKKIEKKEMGTMEYVKESLIL